jgi:hypothetical protein
MQLKFCVRRSLRCSIAILAIAGLQLAACSTAPSAAPHEKPATVDKDKKTVTLTVKAEERIGVAVAPITEEQVMRTRKVGAEVVGASKVKAATTSSTTGDVWVRVKLNASDAQAMDRNQPIRVLPIDSGDDDKNVAGVGAEVDDAVDSEEGATTDTASNTDADDKPVYFKVKSGDHTLKEGQRARVEFTLQGNGNGAHKIIPYSAVIYDVKGGAWVYAKLADQTFQRQPIKVDYIHKQLAYVLEGPAAGTPIVIRGAAELYGAETGVGK